MDELQKMVFTAPDCLKIDKFQYGYGLVSNQKFNKNQHIYSASCYIVPNNNNKYNLNVKSNDKITTQDIDGVNSVKINENQRIFYTFDCFMNHSCDPNTLSNNYQTLEDGSLTYDTIALKDINIGDQLTCNYLLFDYNDSNEYSFECQCESQICYKTINGFKNLPLQYQKQLLPQCDETVQKQLQTDHPDIFLEIHKDQIQVLIQ